MSMRAMTDRQQLEYHSRAGRIVMDYRKAAFLPDCDTLLVADLHFEKASYLQAMGGAPLPTYDTDDTLARLRDVITHFRPAHVAALGDSFHDIHAGSRLMDTHFNALNDIVGRVDRFTWILGNHDPDIPEGVAGDQQDHIDCTGFLLTHMPETPLTAEGINICGHLHPKVQISTRLRSVSRPCFAISTDRIILPSFGTFTGGLHVDHTAITDALPGERLYIAVGAEGLTPVQEAN